MFIRRKRTERRIVFATCLALAALFVPAAPARVGDEPSKKPTMLRARQMAHTSDYRQAMVAGNLRSLGSQTSEGSTIRTRAHWLSPITNDSSPGEVDKHFAGKALSTIPARAIGYPDGTCWVYSNKSSWAVIKCFGGNPDSQTSGARLPAHVRAGSARSRTTAGRTRSTSISPGNRWPRFLQAPSATPTGRAGSTRTSRPGPSSSASGGSTPDDKCVRGGCVRALAGRPHSREPMDVNAASSSATIS